MAVSVCPGFVASIEISKLFGELSMHLTVSSTCANYSKIAYGQKCKNNNKIIKSTRSYINLVNKEDSSHFRKFEICLPEILLEKVDPNEMETKHKEESIRLCENILEDCNKYISKQIHFLATSSKN